jgi:vanillate/3-O-methylgallate O-demethylase
MLIKENNSKHYFGEVKKMMYKNTRINLFNGFGIFGKNEYTTWQDEQMSWKENCYIGDWSWLDETTIKGPDAGEFLLGLCINSFANYTSGKCKHYVMCNSNGKVIGEGILMKHGEDDYEWQGGMRNEFNGIVVDGPAVAWMKYQFSKSNYKAEIKSAHRFFKFQISGPKALFALEKLCGKSLRHIPFMNLANAEIDVLPVRLMRQGMAGEIGFEVQGSIEQHDRIFSAILKAGQEFGMRALGTRTAMINHLEAAFPSCGFDYTPAFFSEGDMDFQRYANPGLCDAEIMDSEKNSLSLFTKHSGSFEPNDISDMYKSPIELGWAKSIKFDHAFIGREALELEIANPKRVLVTLEWNSEDILDVYASNFKQGTPYDWMDVPREEGCCVITNRVLDGERLIGLATARGFSYYFRKMLSHCNIDVSYSAPGTEVRVEWGEPGHPKKLIRAIVAASPYKTDNRKVDLESV